MTRGRLAALVALAAVLYTGAFWLVLSDSLGERQTLVVLVVAAGVVFTVSGTIAASRRPHNRTGGQMLAVGLLWSLGALQASDNATLFTLGYALSGLAFIPFVPLATGSLVGEDSGAAGGAGPADTLERRL